MFNMQQVLNVYTGQTYKIDQTIPARETGRLVSVMVWIGGAMFPIRFNRLTGRGTGINSKYVLM